MSHMAKRYNHRAELRKLIRYFEKSYAAREKDSTYPWPTVKAAVTDGAVSCSKLTLDAARRNHPDLDERVRELIELGPHRDSGKAQKKSPPGKKPEDKKQALKPKQIRELTDLKIEDANEMVPLIQEAKKIWLTRTLERWGKDGKGISYDQDGLREADIVAKFDSNVGKLYPKDINGSLKLDHKHEHVHRVAEQIIDMTPEERAQFERESMREINSFEEQERKARSLKPAKAEPLTVEARDAVSVN